MEQSNKIRENLSNKMRELNYWGDKMAIMFESLDTMKKNGLAKYVAEYLLEEEIGEKQK